MSAPTITPEKLTDIFVEYLTYDAYNVQAMCSFVASYPVVLEHPQICHAIVKNPLCYETLKQMNWWDKALSHAENSDKLPVEWLRQNHVAALAYEATSEQLREQIDWPSWEGLIQEYDVMHTMKIVGVDPFYRARALLTLATRLGTDLAPAMCASFRVLLPLNEMEKVVGASWTPLQKAQYGWFLQRADSVNDYHPTPQEVKDQLRAAQKDVGQWVSLVPESALLGLNVLHNLNGMDLDETIIEFIRSDAFRTPPQTIESLDYTIGLGG